MTFSLRAIAVAAAASLLICSAEGVKLKKGKNTLQFYRTSNKYNITSRRMDAPGVVNVAIIPHTHNDVGWLKTVDQYATGSFNNIQHANVFSIITAMISELSKDPARRFSYVEMAFFSRWFEHQSPDMQLLVQELVATGQLQFINGGWCMHDEANPSYVDMIDQTTLGHRFISQNFNGITPTVTWQIDPFGHSAVQAYLMSSPMSGFNAVFFARSDFEDFASRQANLSTEFFWNPSPSLGRSTATMGGILNDYYYPPSGLNFGGDDNTQPIVDEEDLEGYNVPDVVDIFLNYVQSSMNFTRGTDMMTMMGTDFSYENAVTWYSNIDKLIHYVNLNTSIHGVHAYYSTPADYANAKIQNTILPQRTDDMLPYFDGPHAGWQGYFTSRTTLKAYIRSSSSVHQSIRQAQAFGSLPADLSPSNPLYLLERAMGVSQHHDAIAGTAKQAVAYDYALRIANGLHAAQAGFSQALNSLISPSTNGITNLTWIACDLANATICPITESTGNTVLVALWNSQGQARTAAPVRIPVATNAAYTSWSVMSSGGNSVAAQLLPSSAADISLRTTYYNATNTVTMQWLAFQAALPAAGYFIVALTPVAAVEEAPLTYISKVEEAVLSSSASFDSARITAGAAPSITNGIVTITFDAVTGRVSSMSKNDASISIPLSHDFLWYNSSNHGGPDDNTSDSGQVSGAYIFRPNSSVPFPVSSAPVTITLVTGPIVNEARQQWSSNWASQVVRLWAGASTADFEWTIGPIPSSYADGLGKEVISQYNTSLDSNSIYFTDSNCRDSMKRKRNVRPSWNYTVYEPIASNYYPVNSFAYLSSATTGNTFSIITDRSNGGASITDGSLELMVHRRLAVDDNRGVGEPLNETGINGLGLIARGLHTISLETAANAGLSRRTALANQMFPPTVSLASLPSSSSSASQWFASGVIPSYSGLSSSSPLPANVHLLTVHAHSFNTILLRLAHMYEVGEDETHNMSMNATVNLASLFANLTIESVVETTLTANQPLASVPPVVFSLDDGTQATLPVVPVAPAGALMTITLAPLEIRTFILTVSSSSSSA